MSAKSIVTSTEEQDTLAQLKLELESARTDLNAAEAELAREQAQVNAFRMHARLKLDSLVETLLEWRAKKQTLLIEISLLQEGIAWPASDEDKDFLWDEEDKADWVSEEEILLPTPTPYDKAAEKRLYRELARRFHPDLAKNSVERAYRTTVMAAVNQAREVSDLEALYDLAGELEPGEISELAGIESVKLRKLRKQIMKIRHRQRKVSRQMDVLHRDNTAQLWRKAKLVDNSDGDWWSIVRHELSDAILRREAEVLALQKQARHLKASAVVEPLNQPND